MLPRSAIATVEQQHIGELKAIEPPFRLRDRHYPERLCLMIENRQLELGSNLIEP
jgi:hypothetical protein